jgi:hypothetical protein
LRPDAEEPAPGADDDGGRRNGHVVDHILIEPLPYRDPTVEVHATNAVSTSRYLPVEIIAAKPNTFPGSA